jgi:hypothetical protein
VHHLYPSSARSLQYMPTHPTSLKSISILSSHLCLDLPSGLLPSGFRNKTLYAPPLSPIRATCPVHLSLPDLINNRFVTWLTFYGEEMLAPRPTPKLEEHPLSAVRDTLFNTFAATLHIRRPFLLPQPEDAPCCGDGPTYQHSRLIFSTHVHFFFMLHVHVTAVSRI